MGHRSEGKPEREQNVLGQCNPGEGALFTACGPMPLTARMAPLGPLFGYLELFCFFPSALINSYLGKRIDKLIPTEYFHVNRRQSKNFIKQCNKILMVGMQVFANIISGIFLLFVKPSFRLPAFGFFFKTIPIN